MRIKGQISRLLAKKEAVRMLAAGYGDVGEGDSADMIELVLADRQAGPQYTLTWLANRSGVSLDTLSRLDKSKTRSDQRNTLAWVQIEAIRKIATALCLPSLATLLDADNASWHIEKASEWRQQGKDTTAPITAVLAERQMSWTSLAKAVGGSYIPSFQKLDDGTSVKVSLERLERVCAFLDLSVDILLRYEPPASSDGAIQEKGAMTKRKRASHH